MANVLPTLRGSSQQVLYGVTRTVSCLTKVIPFRNGSEQRWAQRPPLMGFTIPMSGLSAADKASWLTFFSTIKGRLTKDLQLTMAGVTYSNLAAMADELEVLNQRTLQFDQEIHLRQVLNYPYTFPSALSAYPTLAFGAKAEMPYTQISRFQTAVTDNPFGPRFGFGWYGTGLTNFPTTYLRSWKIQYGLISDADTATIEAAFLGWQGRYKTFSFVDPLDGTTYNNVRMGSDDLSIRYMAPNQNATEINLIQTFV